MKIDLQMLKTVLRLCKSNKIEVNIDIFGDLQIEYGGGVYNLGVKRISINSLTREVDAGEDDIKEELAENFSMRGYMLERFYRDFMWLDYIEYMDVKIGRFETIGELLDKLLKLELKNKKLKCLDCLYSYNGDSYGMFSLFKDGTYTKSYYIIDNNKTHVKIHQTNHIELLDNINRFSLVSYSPNYETPDKDVQVYQLSRYCNKVDDFTFNVIGGNY